ncbi:hypothetical protein BD779DRAFT_1552133 [Infundibulicybe gibba]|nr:hypothetical protein BD779DRAFT_1552133 [Infundibulicybe gibba]
MSAPSPTAQNDVQPPSIENTFGALLLGSFFTCILYGLTTHQTYRYFRLYPGDHWNYKFLVSFTWLLDTLHTCMVIHLCYFYLVLGYFDPSSLENSIWYAPLNPLIIRFDCRNPRSLRVGSQISTFRLILPDPNQLAVGLTIAVAMLNNIFYIWKVYILKFGYTIPVVISSFARLVSGIYVTTQIFIIKRFIDFLQYFGLALAALLINFLSDLIFSGSVVYLLRRRRTGHTGTDSIIDTLMLYSINAGILNSIVTLASAITLICMPDNLVYLSIHLLLCKFYSNSMLAVLNSRYSLRDRGAEGFEMGALDLQTQHNQTNPSTWGVPPPQERPNQGGRFIPSVIDIRGLQSIESNAKY